MARFESGALQMHSSDTNVSAAAITGLKRQILDFDEMIGRSDVREAQVAEKRTQAAADAKSADPAD